MLEVINRCINRRAPGSPASRAGWRRDNLHMSSFNPHDNAEAGPITVPTVQRIRYPHFIENRSTEGRNHLLRVAQLMSARSWI